MATLSIFAATLLLLLAISNATVYQTTIITREDESESNQGGQISQRCRQQIQGQQFQQCEQYIRQQAEQQGGRPDDVQNQQQQREQQMLRQCCEALQNMDQQCQCEGLHQIVQRQQGQQQEQQEMMQVAHQLPERCGSGQACRGTQVVWF